jgi:hypothetical protein
LCAASSRSLLSSAWSHTRDHHAFPRPRERRPREGLLARLALPPHLDASARLLRHSLLDQGVNVRRTAVASPRAVDWIGGGWGSRQMMQHSDSADEEM